MAKHQSNKSVVVSTLGDYIEQCLRLEAESDGEQGFDHYWYRGQECADWCLVPSFLRYDEATSGPWEFNMFIEFIARSKALVANPPSRDDVWDWMTFGRHFGLPTRLLDWSFSPLAALYFALLREFDGDSAVWVLCPITLNKRVLNRREHLLPPRFKIELLDDPLAFAREGTDADELRRRISSYLPVYWKAENDDRGVSRQFAPTQPIALLPVQSNPRIAAQQGSYTVHPPAFERGAKRVDGCSNRCLAGLLDPILLDHVVIPRNSRAKLRADLRRLVPESAMFPEPESLCRDLAEAWMKQH